MSFCANIIGGAEDRGEHADDEDDMQRRRAQAEPAGPAVQQESSGVDDASMEQRGSGVGAYRDRGSQVDGNCADFPGAAENESGHRGDAVHLLAELRPDRQGHRRLGSAVNSV